MRLRVLTILLVIMTLPLNAEAVKYLEYYTGLPNYETNPPFTVADPKGYMNLRKILTTIRPSKKNFEIGSVKVDKDWNIPVWTNISDKTKYLELKKIINKLAPAFNPANLTLWVTNLNNSKENDLIVGYIDISKADLAQYPYLSLWLLKFENDTCRTIYAGPFLNGTLHAVEEFGPKYGKKSVVVKHVSCIECEPVIYLSIIDFNAKDDAQPYEFTYSEKHDGFDSTIEYGLPGMGHTVDAKVETRIPPLSEKGPHLLQLFKMEEGPDEWWAFTCKDYRCDYQLFKHKLPGELRVLWKKSRRL